MKIESFFEKLLNEIVNIPLVKQAAYSDPITRKFVDAGENDWLSDQLSTAETKMDEINYEKWNACSVGNIAYIAVYASDSEIRTRAQKIIFHYLQWYKS